MGIRWGGTCKVLGVVHGYQIDVSCCLSVTLMTFIIRVFPDLINKVMEEWKGKRGTLEHPLRQALKIPRILWVTRLAM